ncbi:type III secretion system cytoplasmic ring protein SctQ [Hyalangium versicolor]|uniref:type III secretion system cytoplasmic ring protein SctQ n=1 Tax=Hyalangium versicolor TaxID=2861190 RepID=UPI001CCF8A34|nr:type III secretion system cytoplasmic ring protein SctQ [Hyalangium versicolor]
MSLGRDDEPGYHERTMLVDLRQIHSERPWKPFRFRNLPKVERNQTEFIARLHRLAPPARAVEPLYARLKALFDADARLALVDMQIRPVAELRKHLGDPSVLTVLAPGALKSRVVLEVELALAHNLVDMLLGGAGETVGLRPLTDIEEGVMSFVVLEALKSLAPSLEPTVPRLRFESLARTVDEVSAKIGDDELLLVIQSNITVGPYSGMVRLIVPASVMSAADESRGNAERRVKLLAEAKANLRLLSTVRTWLRAEIGQAEIASSDLAYIRVKDVVLMDALTARPDRGEPGMATLRVGLGSSRVECEVFVEDGQYKARVKDIVIGEPAFQRVLPQGDEPGAQGQGSSSEEVFTNPENEIPPESEGDSLDANKPEGGELLADIPLQLAVELARVPVTADEVVALKVGQVIELHRSPGEPVELSVNGKVVARGELVEIEGQLGVRVLSLAG